MNSRKTIYVLLLLIIIAGLIWFSASRRRTPARVSPPPPPEPTHFSLSTSSVEYGQGSSTIKLDIAQIRQLLAASGSVGAEGTSWQDYDLTNLSSSYTMLPDDTHGKLYLALQKISDSSTSTIRILVVYERAKNTARVAVPPGPGLSNISDIALSPDGGWLAVGECFRSQPAGCYRLSANIYVFDLAQGRLAEKVLNDSTGGARPKYLVTLAGWKAAGQVDYRTYQRLPSSVGRSKNSVSTSTIDLGPAGQYSELR